MTENEAIELHIAENLHRIEVIEEFLRTNSDADDKECKKNIQIFTKINGALQELQQYRSIGTVEECWEARERHMPKKVYSKDGKLNHCEADGALSCPVCKAQLNYCEYQDIPFCYNCGQKLDWGK